MGGWALLWSGLCFQRSRRRRRRDASEEQPPAGHSPRSETTPPAADVPASKTEPSGPPPSDQPDPSFRPQVSERRASPAASHGASHSARSQTTKGSQRSTEASEAKASASTTVQLPGSSRGTSPLAAGEPERDAGEPPSPDVRPADSSAAELADSVSGETAAEAAAGEGQRRRVRFCRRGRLRRVPPEEQRADVWQMDRSRQLPNPERRQHVLRTINERGGWLLAPRRPGYVYCPPAPTPTAAPDDQSPPTD